MNNNKRYTVEFKNSLIKSITEVFLKEWTFKLVKYISNLKWFLLNDNKTYTGRHILLNNGQM